MEEIPCMEVGMWRWECGGGVDTSIDEGGCFHEKKWLHGYCVGEVGEYVEEEVVVERIPSVNMEEVVAG